MLRKVRENVDVSDKRERLPSASQTWCPLDNRARFRRATNGVDAAQESDKVYAKAFTNISTSIVGSRRRDFPGARRRLGIRELRGWLYNERLLTSSSFEPLRFLADGS